MNEDDDSIHKQIQLDGRESEPKATEGGEPVGPIKQFYCDLVLVLTEPKLFFESRFSETSLSYALAFGIIVNWIAAALSWLTRTIRHETIFDSLIKMRETLQELPFWKNVPDNFWAQTLPEPTSIMPAWGLEIFGILVSPFQTLIRFTFYGILLLLGSLMLIPRSDHQTRDGVELKTTMKILAFSSAPLLVGAMLGFLPLGLSSVIGAIYAFVLIVFGLSIRFRVSLARAFGVVVLPGILGVTVLGCIIGVFAGLFFGLIASIFSGFH